MPAFQESESGILNQDTDPQHLWDKVLHSYPGFGETNQNYVSLCSLLPGTGLREGWVATITVRDETDQY